MTSQQRSVVSRRSVLQLCSGFIGASIPFRSIRALADVPFNGLETYGLSIFGDLGLPKDFKSFAYVNPQAPKGGQIALQPSGVAPTSARRRSIPSTTIS